MFLNMKDMTRGIEVDQFLICGLRTNDLFFNSQLANCRIYFYSLPYHHPSQCHQEQRQEQPAQYSLQDHIIPVPSNGQKVDGTLG